MTGCLPVSQASQTAGNVTADTRHLEKRRREKSHASESYVDAQVNPFFDFTRKDGHVGEKKKKETLERGDKR